MNPEELLPVIAVKMIADPNYMVYIRLASPMASKAYFGERWAYAVALLAAHMWTLSAKRAGQTGVETYRAEGRLMQSFGGVGVIHDGLELTSYGMLYKTLVNQCGVGATTSNSDLLTNGMMQ